MAAYGLYTHIASNKTRSMLLLAGLFVLIYVMVFAGTLIAEVARDGNRTAAVMIDAAAHNLVKALPYATAGAAAWIAIAYFFHQSMIDAVTGSDSVTRQQQPRLYNLLENLCISRGIPMPRLKVMESTALNAFATGLNPQQYAITVTTGLLQGLDDDEMESVLGHELTHIRNGDVQLMVVAVIIAGVVGFTAELLFRLFINSGFRFGGSSRSSSSSENNKSGGGAVFVVILAVALVAIAWALSLVVRFALSRSRELLADAGSVQLTKNPDAMISALRKIENRGELPGATSAVMEMCIDNPREGFADLFATHPSIESRVAALVNFAGGRDPGPLALPPPADLAPADAGDFGAVQPQPGPWGEARIPHGAPGALSGSAAGPWGRHS